MFIIVAYSLLFNISKIGFKKLRFNSFRIIKGCLDTEIASFQASISEVFSGLLFGLIKRIGQSQ
jgi:hypothetical protein